MKSSPSYYKIKIRGGRMALPEEIKEKIRELRDKGYKYQEIADELKISLYTVHHVLKLEQKIKTEDLYNTLIKVETSLNQLIKITKQQNQQIENLIKLITENQKNPKKWNPLVERINQMFLVFFGKIKDEIQKNPKISPENHDIYIYKYLKNKNNKNKDIFYKNIKVLNAYERDFYKTYALLTNNQLTEQDPDMVKKIMAFVTPSQAKTVILALLIKNPFLDLEYILEVVQHLKLKGKSKKSKSKKISFKGGDEEVSIKTYQDLKEGGGRSNDK